MGRLLNPNLLQDRGNRAAKVQRTPSEAAVLARPGWSAPAAKQVARPVDSAEVDPFRKFAFRAGLALLFVRVAVLPELLLSLLHTNTYILYLVGPPAMIGAVLTGGVGRTLRHRAAWLWLGFVFCMMVSVPFSSWMGDSVGNFKGYLEYSLPLLFTVGGLALNFDEVRSTFYAIGGGGLIVIGAARLFATVDDGRVDMASATGTIGNSNDLASHLIFVLPFLLFIAMDRRRAAVIRYGLIGPAAYALWVILGTASRGALIALGVSFLFVLLWASARGRLVALVIALALAVSIPLFLGGNAADRLGSLFGGKHEEAEESEDVRRYVLKESLIYTLQHPMFGVGLGQFSNFEGAESVAAGKVGSWHVTHNSFTQVSSECGMPALIFFVLAIGSALFSVNRVYRQARREGYRDIANASFCYLLSMVGFLVTITFLANAYRFYFPAMIGLAIALCVSAEREMSMKRVQEPVKIPTGFGPVPGRARLVQP